MKVSLSFRPLSNFDRFKNFIDIASTQTTGSEERLSAKITDKKTHAMGKTVKDFAKKYMPSIQEHINKYISRKAKNEKRISN